MKRINMNNDEKQKRLDRLSNFVSPAYSEKARIAFDECLRPGRNAREALAEAIRILEQFESRAEEERQKVIAQRQAQSEADRRASIQIAHDRALAEARTHPKTPMEIVLGIEASGIILEVDEGNRIIVRGGVLSPASRGY